MRPRSVLLAVLAFLLWIVTAAVGLWEIIIVRDMVLRVFARFWGNREHFGTDYWVAVQLGQWTVVLLALVWIVLVIGSGEYHYRRLGQRSSWRLFGWTIAGELAILVLAYFI